MLDAGRLVGAATEPQNWFTGGRDAHESYFSPLESINRENIQRLGFAWQYEIDTTAGFEATPIVIDGVLFTSGPKGAVYSLNAKTGHERWKFEPRIDGSVASKLCCGTINRGVAVWKGVVYVGSLDGYLYALNADTGAILWRADTLIDHSRGYSITGAPYIASGMVVIGNSGSEFDARGYITAYDSRTGKQRWRFFTVPTDPSHNGEQPELAMAARTWDPRSPWQEGLGGTVWDGMAYDPKLNLLYIGTDNGAPQTRKLRSPAGGDNLFLCSILAINPETGRLVWYYQTTPADNWDYSAVQKMILADLTTDGHTEPVIMQASKNGFFYVLDRRTGRLVSAKPYVRVTWASHIDPKTGRPVETGQGDYSDHAKLVFPSWFGGHNWQPMAFNPETGLVYIPTLEAPVIFAISRQPVLYHRGVPTSPLIGVFPTTGPLGIDTLDPADARQIPALDTLTRGQPDPTLRSFLRAWDPVRQRLVWEADSSGPWEGEAAALWNGGGVMTTASGLVFQGRATGDLVVLDARTGELLHTIPVGTGIMAAPMTYTVDGVQYVAVMAGMGGVLGGLAPVGSAAYRYGNRGRIVAFTLGGGAVPHPPELRQAAAESVQPAVARRGTRQSIEQGAMLFRQNCSRCHTNSGQGSVPDLRRMSAATHAEFADILLKGTRAQRGMGNFSGLLSPAQVESIHDYLIDLAWRSHDSPRAASNAHQAIR
jgi:quinohemoprotein ethanol dehydrogenase